MRQSESPSVDPASPAQAAVANPQSIVLEALKLAYASTGERQFLDVHEQLRGRIEQRPQSGPAPGTAIHSEVAGPARTPAPGESTPQVPQTDTSTVIRMVCATREDRDGFFSSTPLGRSLTLHRPDAVQIRLFPNNTQGLPTVYNTAIVESAGAPVIMLFVHDDIHLCDFHWADSLRAALRRFDIVGLAGNRRRLPKQPAWGHVDERFNRDDRANLSGTVAHGSGFPAETVDVFGPSGQRVAMLDGLFLAVRSETLRVRSVRFDERFGFHFYDLDFCRQAERAGLAMGTWPISVVHESKGGYTSDGWRHGYETYLEKWGD